MTLGRASLVVLAVVAISPLTAAGFIIALDDSDIIASAAEGHGGNITLNTPGFFGRHFTLASLAADPDTLDGNNRVDINATGAVNGVVTVPDISFIENILNSLPEAIVAPEQMLAGSCIARVNEDQGSFVVTGGEGLPTRPENTAIATFHTGVVRSISDTDAATVESGWQQGDPMREPTGVYELADGRLVLSHTCE
ncbi:MAG: S-layer family protein [Leptolyngbya sp. SIOISBB]|nr:S-layer family protein [Leptolyngbya sp. SIOISBB]